jgi:hypothetical protein
VCGAAVRIEPSQPFGDAPCPACGALLWFVSADEGARFFDPRDPDLVDRLAGRLGVSPELISAGRWRDAGIDSLDLVELVMELEELEEVGE